MAEKRSWSLTQVIFLILSLELLVVVFFVPASHVTEFAAAQRVSIAETLGVDAETQVKSRADGWFRTIILESGVYRTINDFLFDRWEQREDEEKLDDRGISSYVERRLDTLWISLHTMLYRAATIFLWVPYVVPLFLSALIDGVLTRETRKWQFSYTSPMLHTSAVKIAMAVFIGLLMVIILPMNVPPLVYPSVFGLVAFCVWAMIASMAKRF